MNWGARARVAVVLGALVGWWWIDQVSDWSRGTMIAGVVVIALACPVLDRWAR